MKKIFLVDTENVNLSALNLCEKLTTDDTILFFVTAHTDTSSYSDQKVCNLNTMAHLMKMRIKTEGKNSLDFQLVSYLGFLLGLNSNEKELNEYYIISNDKGFLSSIRVFKNCTNNKIELISSIKSLFVVENKKTNNISFLSKLINKGFKDTTAIKLLSIIENSKTLDIARNRIWIALNLDNNLSNNCEEILREFFNDDKVIEEKTIIPKELNDELGYNFNI